MSDDKQSLEKRVGELVTYIEVHKTKLESLTAALEQQRVKVEKNTLDKAKIYSIAAVLVVLGAGAVAGQWFSASTLSEIQNDAKGVAKTVEDVGRAESKKATELIERTKIASIDSFLTETSNSVLAALPIGTTLCLAKPSDAEESPRALEQLRDAGYVQMTGQTITVKGSDWLGQSAPDMRERFLMGSSLDTPMGTQGEASMDVAGEHDHGGITRDKKTSRTEDTGAHSPSDMKQGKGFDGHTIDKDGSHTHANNRPKFLAVQYWLKVK